MDYEKLMHPEEKILSVSKTTLTIGREHVTNLSRFGTDETRLDKFETDIAETEALSDENKERIDLKILTFTKDEAIEACYRWNREVSLRIEMAFGKKSVEFLTFPSKLLLDSRGSESKMSPITETIHQLATEYAVALEPFGQTAAILAEGETLMIRLREADSIQDLQKVHKKKATQFRHKRFNELVSTVNEINKLGRNIYRNDPVNYVLFESPWDTYSASNSIIYEGDIEPDLMLSLAKDLALDTQIQLENKGTTDLLFYAGVLSETFPGIILTPGEEVKLYLSDIGEGTSLSVKNMSINEIGIYSVII